MTCGPHEPFKVLYGPRDFFLFCDFFLPGLLHFLTAAGGSEICANSFLGMTISQNVGSLHQNQDSACVF